MINFLEQLVAEWYEFNGYYVRRNVRVGPLAPGGHESELDVVAFNPETRHLVHVEPSMDADSWEKREERFARKFSSGKKYIPGLFGGLVLPTEIEHVALLVFGSTVNRSSIGGGKILMMADFMNEIRNKLKGRRFDKAPVAEQYLLLRALQCAVHYWD